MLEVLLGSRLRSKVLGWLFTHPDERFFVRQLTALVDEDSTNVSRELTRLEKMGILVSTTEGKQKYYQANRNSPLFNELRGLIVKTTGIVDVLRSELSLAAAHITLAFVYGSMASGEATSMSDIDLLVVGDIDDMVLHRAISQAEKKLARPVNYTLMSRSEFQERRRDKGGFLERLLSGPKLMILGSTDEIR